MCMLNSIKDHKVPAPPTLNYEALPVISQLRVKGRRKDNTTRFYLKGLRDPIIQHVTLPELVCFSIRYCKPQEKSGGPND